MTNLHQYALIGLDILLAGIWLATWFSHTSARSKQWQIVTSLAALPVAILAQWAWPWSVAYLSQSTFWAYISLSIAICLSLSLVTIWPYKWLKHTFQQPIQFSWPKYGLTLAAGYIILLIAHSLPWSSLLVVVGCLSILNLLIVFIHRSTTRPLIIQLLCGLLGLALATICGLAAGLFDQPYHFNASSIGFSWAQLAALALLAAIWPSLCQWWTNQQRLGQ